MYMDVWWVWHWLEIGFSGQTTLLLLFFFFFEAMCLSDPELGGLLMVKCGRIIVVKKSGQNDVQLNEHAWGTSPY